MTLSDALDTLKPLLEERDKLRQMADQLRDMTSEYAQEWLLAANVLEYGATRIEAELTGMPRAVQPGDMFHFADDRRREGKAEDWEAIDRQVMAEFGPRAAQMVARQNAEFEAHLQAGDALNARFEAEWQALAEAANARVRELGGGDEGDIAAWFEDWTQELNHDALHKSSALMTANGRGTNIMSLATALQRLETKADADALIAQLAAKEKEARAKSDAVTAIVTAYGLPIYVGSEELQKVVDRMQDDQSKAEELEADLEILQEEMAEIGAQLDEAGLEYPYGLELDHL